MEVDFKHDIRDKVISSIGEQGIITSLGVNSKNTPVFWVNYKNKDIVNNWEIADKCIAAPDATSTPVSIDFYYAINAMVFSPLSKGIITFLEYGEDEKVSCFVVNKEQGVANDWWPAETIK